MSVTVSRHGRWRTQLALAFVLAVAAWLRFDGLNWDDGAYPHPDERYMSMVVAAVGKGKLEPVPAGDAMRAARRAACHAGGQSRGAWTDTACSDFNPENVGHPGYPYGPLPLAVVRLAADAASTVTGVERFAHYGGIHFVGRAFSAACDLLTVVVTFLLGRLLWGRRVGVLAAAFYALAVLPIQLSHFWTVDTGATLFALLALLFLVRLVRFGQRMDAAAFGVAFGLGLACKISIAPLILLLPLAVAWMPARAAFTGSPDLLTRVGVRLPDALIACVAALITFRLASPFAFEGPGWLDVLPAQAFLDQVANSRRLASGSVDIPPNWQWLGRTPWIDAGRNLLLWGLGPALGIVALVGTLFIGWRSMRAAPLARARALLCLWTIGYFGWMGMQWVASMRYLMPIYPTLCILAAAWLASRSRAQGIAASATHRRTLALSLPAVLVVGLTTAWALAYHRVPTTTHPYVAATHWMLRHAQAPVSARVRSASGVDALINWPAAGRFGSSVPAQVAASTRAPVSGVVTELRLHRIVREAGAPAIALRVLDADGRLLASTARREVVDNGIRVDAQAESSHAAPSTEAAKAVPLFAPDPGARSHGDAVALQGEAIAQAARPPLPAHDVVLPLDVPLRLVAGGRYRLQVDVQGGDVMLEGASIAIEGAWNDTVPARVDWRPGLDVRPGDAASGSERDDDQVDPFGQRYFRAIDLAMSAEDDNAKRARLVDGLDAADWLVVPNQRFHASMTRNPLRFPLATRFYERLFTGELGFSPAFVADASPRIAGVRLIDQPLPDLRQQRSGTSAGSWWTAEEAFSVYDHPAVLVFRKRADYSRASVEAMFDDLNLVDIRQALAESKPTVAGRLSWSTQEASFAPDGLARVSRTQGASSAERQAHAVATPLGEIVATLAWYFVSFALGACAWAWLAWLWPGWPDRGYAVARIAGLLAIGVPAWWLASAGVSAWSVHGLAWLALAWSVATVAFALRMGPRRLLPAAVFRRALRVEAVFAALFVLGIGLRLVHPDLWAPALGGEKPMDYAMFNAVLGTDVFPPDDPWFSGGRLNYYYFGLVLAGVLAKLSGTPAGLAYNLALASWFAMVGVGAGALAAGVCARWGRSERRTRACWTAGAFALAAAVLMGNLDLPRAVAPSVKAGYTQLASDVPSQLGTWRELVAQHSVQWLWAPTRTVGELTGASHEINEFPAFTFLFGDLHAHLLSMPLQLLALFAWFGMAASLPAHQVAGWARLAWLLPRTLALAVPVGLLRSTNTWDWPVYLLLAAAATAALAWHEWPKIDDDRRIAHRLRRRLLFVAVALATLLVAQAIVTWPFRHFVAGPVDLQLFTGMRTPLVSWLAMHGWFVIVLVGWSIALARRRETVPEPAGRAATAALRGLALLRVGGIALTVAALPLAAFDSEWRVPAFGLQVALIAWLIELAWTRTADRETRAGLGLAIAGWCIALVPEIVVLGRDMGRMNTFFKLHIVAWLLLSIASGVALGSLARGLSLGPARTPWRAAFGIATLVALAYLPLASHGRWHSRFDRSLPWTIDGEAFLANAVHHHEGHALPLADDKRLIDWVRRHAAPDDVVLEAQLPEYRWGSRISTFTGRPTVLGYRQHQSQQRPLPALGEAIELRRRNVEAIYASEAIDPALAALHRYRVRYVVVGALERAVYPAAGLAKFEALVPRGALELAFASGDDRIYRVVATRDPHRGGRLPSW